MGKLGFIGGLHGEAYLKVSLKPFQRLVGAAAIGGRSSQRAKPLIVGMRHRGMNDKPYAWQRGTAQVGGSPFYVNGLIHYRRNGTLNTPTV